LSVSPTSGCVLVLEDSVLVAMAIEATLVDHGYDTISAGTLAAAHDRLGRTLPVAALLDLHLPDGNSVALAKSLHARGCKVAFCSGSDTVPDDCGFAASFRKPVIAADLVRWLEEVTRDDEA
jgi:DNA-binding response OmpR family regulator